MENFLDQFVLQAKSIPAKIVYDEIEDERIVKAVLELKSEGSNPVVV